MESLLEKAKRLNIQPAGKPTTAASSPAPIPATTSSGSLIEKAKKLGMRPAGVATPPPSDVKGGFIGDVLTGSTQRFGKTAGEALAAPGNAQRYADALETHTKLQNDLIKTIRAKKALGQDTSRLESALEHHIESTPKLLDFTGDVINKTTEQVLGEAGGTLLEASTGGALGSEAKILGAGKKLSTGTKILEGAKIGAGYGAIGGATGAMQENKSASDVIASTAKGGALGGVIGGGIGAVGGILAKKGAQVGEKATAKIEKATGQILQGEAKDVQKGIKVLSNLDTKGVKTYEELTNRLDKKIETLSTSQDKLLEKDLTRRKLGQLNAETTVGDKVVKHNFVHDAINQLDEFYQKTNNIEGQTKMKTLRAKAAKEGLTVKEINDLAKVHGSTLNAFNASGELASGLSKQASENTRAGLKKTVRQLYGGKASEAIDREITNTIRIRDLSQGVQEKVNQLQQKIQQRSLGAKAGYIIGKVVNLLGLGSPKGIVEALLPRGQGFKVLNALDLEAALEKNLRLLEDIVDKKIPEDTLIQRLDQFINQEVNLSNQSSKAGKSQVKPLRMATKSQRPPKIAKKAPILKNIPRTTTQELEDIARVNPMLVRQAKKAANADEFIDAVVKVSKTTRDGVDIPTLTKFFNRIKKLSGGSKNLT